MSCFNEDQWKTFLEQPSDTLGKEPLARVVGGDARLVLLGAVGVELWEIRQRETVPVDADDWSMIFNMNLEMECTVNRINTFLKGLDKNFPLGDELNKLIGDKGPHLLEHIILTWWVIRRRLGVTPAESRMSGENVLRLVTFKSGELTDKVRKNTRISEYSS